ncbi:ABC transporter substrate-binding protein [Massilia scottii]|uniref:ABC transporter substrate-binding protein n=1 Tax=Massilia scottii TaxID=3057166 RepID=UPI00279682AB|nr:ABC transporter substrate-binding protein [Massilia sp. CCM 9029]MDQ1830455.1 ABC transporter substrate-binding protein [Massilia sp. CCM 9029]
MNTFSPLRRVALFALMALCAAPALAQRKVVDAANRAVTVPERAQRVVALSELDLDALLALKIKPAGATKGRGQTAMPRYLGATAATIPSAGNFAAPVLDLVVGMQPDLILAGGMSDPELLSQLAKIAPTVVTYQPGENWQATFRRIGAVMGKSADADAFLADYIAKAGALRQRLGERANTTVSVVRWNPQGPSYMLRDSFASLVLADLKMRRPAAQMQPGAAHSRPLSLEALAAIDADWIFVGTLSASGPANDALAAARQSPPFRQLGASQRNQVRAVDGSLWTSPGGPLAALAVLADIDKALAAP